MIKQITTAILLTLSLYGYGQCKYEYNKIDEITGQIKKRTKETYVTGDLPAFGVQLSQTGLNKYIVFQVYTSTIQSINSESKIMLKSANGEIFEFMNTFKTVSHTHPSGWRTPFYIEFNESTKSILLNHTIIFARFETRELIIDRKVNEKGARRIKQIMDCI